MNLNLLCLGILLYSVQGLKEPEKEVIKSWPPTLDDKPWDERNFGDSTKVPLQPVFNQKTVKFIKAVLNTNPQPAPLQANYTQTTAEHSEMEIQSTYQAPLANMSDLALAFKAADYDHSGKLELTEAKHVFEKFRIHFASMSELNQYFYNEMMYFDLFCDLVAAKGVVTQDEANKAKMTWITDELHLFPTAISNPEHFRYMVDAVYWYDHYMSQPHPANEPLPQPPAKFFPSTQAIEIGKLAIVDHVILLTGRRDTVTYENAHLSRRESERILEQEVANSVKPPPLCHPAAMESCTRTKPCCEGLVCCAMTDNGDGYCSASC